MCDDSRQDHYLSMYLLTNACRRSEPLHDYTALNGRMITEFESMWKEAVVAYCREICPDGLRQALKDSGTDGIR